MHDAGKLLARVANGDKRAFEILFPVFQARFLAVAESVTGDASMAEDAVQEAFVRVLRVKEIHERFKRVAIWCEDFADVMRRYDRPTTFFYADPPYYRFERYYGTCFGRQDHARLVEGGRTELENDLAGVSWNEAFAIVASKEITPALAKKALARAERASELRQYKDWQSLGILAAAHAANGDLPEAIRRHKEAMALAPEAAQPMLQRHLALYEQGKTLADDEE